MDSAFGFNLSFRHDVQVIGKFVACWLFFWQVCGIRFWLSFSCAFAMCYLLVQDLFAVINKPSLLYSWITKIEATKFACLSFVIAATFWFDIHLIENYKELILAHLHFIIARALFYSKRLGMVDRVLPVLLILLGIAYAWKNIPLLRKLMLAFKALISSAGICGAIKFLFHRARPNADPEWSAWEGPGFYWRGDGNYDLSFPSGHASSAVALVTVVSFVFQDHKLSSVISFTAYFISFANAFTRFLDSNHFPSDLVFGAVLGHLIAKICINVSIYLSSGKSQEPLLCSVKAL